jgi:hypothetical protein
MKVKFTVVFNNSKSKNSHEKDNEAYTSGPAIPLLGIYPRKIKTHFPKHHYKDVHKSCTQNNKG